MSDSAPTYGGVYEAQVVVDTGDYLRLLVPQVFGEMPISCTRWVGSVRPTAPQMGYISFIGGDPAWPVWMVGAQISSNGHGPPTTVVGTGADEVWIGTDQPSKKGYDLWIDTDENPPSSVDRKTVLAYAEVTATQSGVTNSPGDLTGLTVNFTAVAGRWYRATGYAMLTASAASSMLLYVMDGVVQLAQAQGYLNTSGYGVTLKPTRVWQPAPGAHALKLQGQATAGGSMFANANTRSYIMVEDLGPV